MPYGQGYGINYSGLAPSREEEERRRRAQRNADFMRFLGAAAPAAGSVVGGGLGAILGGFAGAPAGGVGAIPGAMAGLGIGSAIGGGLGQMAGAGLGYAGDSQMQPYDERELKRQARLRAISQTLGMLR